MPSRMDDRTILFNDDELWEEEFENRGVSYIRQYNTADLTHPTIAQIRKLNRLKHVWKLGDRYYKLAHKHYGDSTMWWVIAWYNHRPPEAHVKIGDVVYIPTPLEIVLRYLRSE